MKVSIIIPAYNAEKYLARTLESVLAQTFTAWELVILDDGSSDGTREIAEAYAAQDGRIRVVYQENGGVAVARREGFARTAPETEAVIFLDNDDVWDLEALAALTEMLEKNPDAVGAYVLARYVDGQGMPIRVGEMEKYMLARRRIEGRRIVSCRPEDLTTFAGFALGNYIPTPGVLLMRRAVFERTGGFDQATAPSDDYDLYLRLSRHGGLALVDRVLFDYRLHGANVSNDKRSMHRSERTVRRKQIADSSNTPEQKRLLIAGFRLREQESYAARMRDAWASLNRREYAAALKTFLYGQANLLRTLRGRP